MAEYLYSNRGKPSLQDMFKEVDVMVCSMVKTGGRVQFMVQVTERGKGHYVVPRRFSSFKRFYGQVRELYGANKVASTRYNQDSVRKWLKLWEDPFPKKTFYFLGIGTSPTTLHVIESRMRFFHSFIFGLVDILHGFNWRGNGALYNPMSNDQANKLCDLLADFLSLPTNFGEGEDYLHRDARCRRQEARHCHLYPIIQDNWTDTAKNNTNNNNNRLLDSLPRSTRGSMDARDSSRAMGRGSLGRGTSSSVTVAASKDHAPLRRKIQISKNKRDRFRNIFDPQDDSTLNSMQSTMLMDDTNGSCQSKMMASPGRKEEVVMLGEELDHTLQLPRRGSTGALGGANYF